MNDLTTNKFYLGRRLALQAQTPANAPPDSKALENQALLYDPRDLTTHAVCLGMTGSGKTGLGIALIEEAALNGIPALVVDPKGDLANLLLAFPSLSAEAFRPWVDPAGMPDGVSLDEQVERVANSWRDGLAQWGLDGGRIARLKRTTEVALYTPGSDAGRQVSIVQSLAAPEGGWQRDTEVLREAISHTVSALLTLIQVRSDPVTGREHNLLSTIVERAWRAGRDMDLAALIAQVQRPPFERLGVLPLDHFYPEKERAALAMALNGLLASPRFGAWLEGAPLRVDSLIRAPDGRPQVSIFYLAHLSDVERHFFVTLLLDQVRSWLRIQEGTSRLRAILYIDELYGMMPPYPANPPTKAPLLALLKQARSQGLGLVLSSQNPVDLDYKGLSNAGTWFIGRLQTANDRQRALEGLREAASGAGTTPDAAGAFGGQTLEEAIAGLKPRTFLLHNVHQEGPALFQTRHTMSYLRGPLTRRQIRRWMDMYEPDRLATSKPFEAGHEPLTLDLPARRPEPAGANSVLSDADRPAEQALSGQHFFAKGPLDPSFAHAQSGQGLPWDSFAPAVPALPAGIDAFFLPVRVPLEWAIRSAESAERSIVYQARQLVYRPALLARATAHIDNSTHNVRMEIAISRALPGLESDLFIDWEDESIPVSPGDLDDRPSQGARFAPVPEALANVRRLRSLERDFVEYVYRQATVVLTRHPLLKLTSGPEERASEFRMRCYRAIAQKRDDELRTLERQTQAKIDRLEARMRREERELEQDEIEYEGRKREEWISAGESVLNLLRRRHHSRMLSVASRRRRLTQQARAEIKESLETLDDLETQIQNLLDQAEGKEAEIRARWSERADDFETIQVRPRKSDIFVKAWSVVWLPGWEIVFKEKGGMEHLVLPAYGGQESA